LSEHEKSTAFQAGVKVLRLAQIVNGFVGGVEGSSEETLLFDFSKIDPKDLETADGMPDLVPCHGDPANALVRIPPSPLREVGREKLDALINYLTDHWADDKLLVFTRFRPDVARTASELQWQFGCHEVTKIWGSQDKDERERAKMLLAPGGDSTPAIVVANATSGGAGLNLAAARLCVFLGNEYSYRVRRQAEGRVDRPGQTGRVTFLDIIATGPQGQRTVDHEIVAALRNGEELEAWGVQEWKKALMGAQEERKAA
jgi:hypothetical protein